MGAVSGRKIKEREQDGLTLIGDTFGELAGPLKTIRGAYPQPRRWLPVGRSARASSSPMRSEILGGGL